MNFTNFYCDNTDNLNLLRSLSRCEAQLSVLCMNAQRICRVAKFTRFSSFIDSFLMKPLILGVTETWFKSGETGEASGGRKPIRLYDLDDYNSHFCSRTTHSAGIALYVLKGFNFEVIKSDNGAVTYIHGRLLSTDKANSDEMYITLIYMPRLADFRELFSLLEQLFSSIPQRRRHMLIGDSNIDISGDGYVAKLYLDLLESFGYCVANDRVTRPTSQTIIDHAVVNFDNVVNYTIANELSDHNCLLVTTNQTVDDRNDHVESVSITY